MKAWRCKKCEAYCTYNTKKQAISESRGTCIQYKFEEVFIFSKKEIQEFLWEYELNFYRKEFCADLAKQHFANRIMSIQKDFLKEKLK